jgi:hypothetical protein
MAVCGSQPKNPRSLELYLLPLLAKQFKVDMEVWVVMHNDLKRISRMRFDHLSAKLAQYAAAAA